MKRAFTYILTNSNPSNFSGESLSVENVSWLDAAAYCNARSEREGLTPVYTIDGQNVSWERSANGYRLPTEAEWEYACCAGTTTPFYIDNMEQYDTIHYSGGESLPEDIAGWLESNGIKEFDGQ